MSSSSSACVNDGQTDVQKVARSHLLRALFKENTWMQPRSCWCVLCVTTRFTTVSMSAVTSLCGCGLCCVLATVFASSGIVACTLPLSRPDAPRWRYRNSQGRASVHSPALFLAPSSTSADRERVSGNYLAPQFFQVCPLPL